jgi:hypothetical protein
MGAFLVCHVYGFCLLFVNQLHCGSKPKWKDTRSMHPPCRMAKQFVTSSQINLHFSRVCWCHISNFNLIWFFYIHIIQLSKVKPFYSSIVHCLFLTQRKMETSFSETLAVQPISTLQAPGTGSASLMNCHENLKSLITHLSPRSYLQVFGYSWNSTVRWLLPLKNLTV